ncbi:hypothetical protein ACYJGC_005219 [Klebsiella pneumoniae]|uniref:hypothetical protein n=1 Tax=Klebsiella pneumoniae TaxID=573 RepID=UPI001CBCF5BB|nr:hypothetical protein [Klebsiella pneumoniae]EKX7637459.1 hypothetical protein [Klebsiella pneumoniae]ELA1308042.1 hypothetical protein [Klebsiella pneumoniae]MBZ1696855.1 hypothetical protein [Klebsiella pneumoniae]HDZ2531261.1 hypothetical protein [Klebsiella pneumoniae]HDZ2539733.1 hypothetical protein [Klebsiella pneumoniae]
MTGTKQKKQAIQVDEVSALNDVIAGSDSVVIALRPTLEYEAALMRDLLAQRYREFGLEKFEDRANEIVDSVRRIFARLAAPLEEDAVEDQPERIDMTSLGDDTEKGVE